MFDFGSGELLVIGVVALVVIGPKELPGVLRTVGKTVARMRRMAGEFQGQFQDALREAELHDAMKSVSDIQTSVSNVTSFNDPLAGLPTPTMPENLTSPPKELQGPVATEPVSPSAPDDKPKAKASKKPKPAEAQKDDPQAVLFDTLDQMNKKAESKSAKTPKQKMPRSVKAKAEKKPAKKATKPSKKKAKSDEASS